MKHGLIILFLILLLNTSISGKGARPLGIGVAIGEPTGITMKQWLSRTTALDGVIGWSLEQWFYVHADFLSHNFNILTVRKGRLPCYFGIGGRILVHKKGKESEEESRIKVGIRAPVGLEYLFSQAPIGIFAEVALIMNLTPNTDLEGGGGVGVRFYFHRISAH